MSESILTKPIEEVLPKRHRGQDPLLLLATKLGGAKTLLEHYQSTNFMDVAKILDEAIALLPKLQPRKP